MNFICILVKRHKPALKQPNWCAWGRFIAVIRKL